MNGKNWYINCKNAIDKQYANSELFIDILAATSPRKHILTNFRIANRIYHRHKNNLPIEYKRLLPNCRANVKRALSGEPLSGNKVRAFAENLKGNLSDVTIDVWILRAFNVKKSLTDKVYAELSRLITQLAKMQNLQPAEYQAIIWSKIQEKHNRKPKSYLSVKDFGQKFFEFYWD